MKRGEVVLVDFPFASGGGSKVRSALIVQNDRGNALLRDTIVVPITSNISRAVRVPTQFAIDATSLDWKSSGLRTPSVVKCENIYTFHQSRIVSTIGRLSAATMSAIDACLKEALGIP
jgi:mRNA-degrading endonuclease toxin of MazEF toxin-antitoxin module